MCGRKRDCSGNPLVRNEPKIGNEKPDPTKEGLPKLLIELFLLKINEY